MSKCFVTKLPVVSGNNDLLKLGECRVSMKCANDKENLISLNNALYYCEQAHTLGDISVAANEQKTVKGWKEIYGVKAGVYTFHFSDKYSIGGLLLRKQHSSNGLSFLTSCSQFMVNSTNGFCIENLEKFKKLEILMILGNVSGDIASLKGLTALNSFSATYGDKITFKAADFSEMPNLSSINVGTKGTPYTGEFGDVATLSPKFIYLFLGGKYATIEWTARPSSSKIISIFGSPKLSNIDKMLQDQAQCVTGITSSSPEYMKSISATGTRTSASDAAVQTLQSKGYTVSITPA